VTPPVDGEAVAPSSSSARGLQSGLQSGGLVTGTTTAMRLAPGGGASPVRQPKNLVAVLLSAVTGLGHLYLDHYVTGAVLFGLFVTAVNGVFLGFTLQSTSSPLLLRGLSILLLVVVWTFGVWHAYTLSYGTDRPALARARAALLREGLVDYLRDDLEAAARKLERAVVLDIDWLDPDPSFHLGAALSRLAERRAARGDDMGARSAQKRAQASFRRCLARDARRKWRAEIADELARMRPRTLTARLRKVGGALKDALETASGVFVRPLAWTLADEPPGGPATAPDTPTVADERPFAQTRKKRRFSAKYAALPPRAEGMDTRADAGTARHGQGPVADPGLDTRVDRTRAPEPGSMSDTGRVERPSERIVALLPGKIVPPDAAPEALAADAVRSVGRFTRASITARLAAEQGLDEAPPDPRLPAVEVEAPPAEAPPSGATPVEAPPVEVAAAEATPAEATPAEATPAEATPAEAPPAEAPLAEATSAEATPAEAPLAEATPVEAPPEPDPSKES
jgi:hypothetical protein